MPEGDTIWRAARALQAALGGRTVTGFKSSLPAVAAAARRLGLVGRPVATVEARGKHLLVRFEGGAVLHTHQGMTGSWHLYRRGSRWRQAPHLARVVLEAGETVAVCFRAPQVELLRAAEADRHRILVRLGPDVMAGGFDAAEARVRLRAAGDEEIGAALLDQSRLAGIGNVYKSETLFLTGLSPFTSVASLPDADLDRLIAQARRLLQANVTASAQRAGAYRTTGQARPGAALWVYGRAGQPCRRCGTLVRKADQESYDADRVAYWCPTCQPGPGPGGP